jgi:hypothetical protein
MIGADSKIIANVNNLARNNKGGISLHFFFLVCDLLVVDNLTNPNGHNASIVCCVLWYIGCRYPNLKGQSVSTMSNFFKKLESP